MRVCVVVCVQLLFCHEFCGFVLFYVQNMCKYTNVGDRFHISFVFSGVMVFCAEINI